MQKKDLKVVGILEIFVGVHVRTKLDNHRLIRRRRLLKSHSQQMHIIDIRAGVHFLAKLQEAV